jgi:hypothetical protein
MLGFGTNQIAPTTAWGAVATTGRQNATATPKQKNYWRRNPDGPTRGPSRCTSVVAAAPVV